MDILDVMLARAMTPQGKTEAYVAKANAAAAKAEKAEQDAAAAIQTVESAADEIATAKSEAADLLATAQEALETVQEAQINTITTEDVDDEISKLAFELTQTSSNVYNGRGYKVLYPDNATTFTMPEVVKLYKSTGDNEDGSMTQKAITAALAQKADTSTVATKAYVDSAIARIPSGSGSSSGGGVSNLGAQNAGKIVIVGSDGNIKAGDATQEAIIKALVKAGTYSADGTLGLLIDYENKSFERTQDAASRRAGSDFNGYTMYGGRMRCNVADDGTITAFYGDSNYREDGSNGQVMIYQPKFYYSRTFIKDSASSRGVTVQKESLILSADERAGFELHPLFKLGDEELDYVLLPAFEGSVYDTSADEYLLNDENVTFSEDKLSSIAGAKIFTGVGKNLNLTQVKTMASNRGEGWQLTNLEFESANQMLEMVEFGTMNGQSALEKGVVNVARNNATSCAIITGSTSSIGNGTGAAPQTIIDRDGTQETVTTAGLRAISYRGMENPWGSMWRLIANITTRGGSNSEGGIPYHGETPLGFQLPGAAPNWISAMGYQNPDYTWAYLPIECANNANSAFPVGDALWTNSALNGTNLFGIGGLYSSGDGAGPFNYSADVAANATLRYFNGRIMFIPTKNATYEANINKWRQHYGG